MSKIRTLNAKHCIMTDEFKKTVPSLHYTTTTLASMYGICRFTFLKRLQDVGLKRTRKQSRYYTAGEVLEVFSRLGIPNGLIHLNTSK
jgi:hypothetical protein